MERRGFTDLTVVQRAVLEARASDANLRITSQTGSGKTVALGLAVAQELIAEAGGRRRGPVTVVVTPTRELAMQVREELGWLFENCENLRPVCVTGGTSIERERKLLKQRPALLVGTPGRLLDHVRAGAVDLSEVRHVVLDEADQMLDMGFRDELEAIVDALPEERRSYLVSATFPREVERFARKFQGGGAQHVEGTSLGAANTDIEHVVHVVRMHDRYDALVNVLLANYGERALVFVRRRADAADVAERLAADGFSAMPLSGDLPQAQRTRTLSAFRHGTVEILVATDVAARGIDVQDIRLVVQYEMPSEAETYTHRSGRTGRAGQQGRCVLLVPPVARRRASNLLSRAKVEAQWGPVPTPAQIRKAVVKATRRQLHGLLEGDQTPEESHLEYARKLIESRDPATVVAWLLQLSQTHLPREPIEVPAWEPRGRDRDQGRDQDRGRDHDYDRDRGEGGDRPPRRSHEDFVNFQINWGSTKGATPARLMAHVCRRGDVGRAEIGAIKILPRSAFFGVAKEAADAFEEKAAAPDERDPHLHIRRAVDRPLAGREGGHKKPRGGPGGRRGGPRKPRQDGRGPRRRRD